MGKATHTGHRKGAISDTPTTGQPDVVAEKSTAYPRPTSVQEELFAQKFVELGNARAAYRAVYGEETRGGSHPWRVFNRAHVKARVDEIMAEHREMHEVTVAGLLHELEEARCVALSAFIPQTSAAIAATMGKAKLVGLDKQVVEHVGKDGSPLNMIVNFVKAAAKDGSE